MRDSDWTRILGWPGYRVWRSEIDEPAKRIKLWVRRKRGNQALICSGCGRRVHEIAAVYEREVRDLPCFEYRTAVVIELYRVKCPDCGLKAEKASQLPGKAIGATGDIQTVHADTFASQDAGRPAPLMSTMHVRRECPRVDS